MHTVIEAHCTGCELCIPVCPVDCISLVDASGARTGWDAWSAASAAGARTRYARHAARVASTPADATARVTVTEASPRVAGAPAVSETVAAAIARARALRAQP
jgi:electron transport complex protein RnfB